MIEGGIDDACRMMVSSGTTSVLDISVGGDSARFMGKHGLRGIVALEVLGDPEKSMQHADKIVREQFELDRGRLGDDAGNASAPNKPEGVDYGFSPHAPYSTGVELYQHAFGRAFGEGRVCTTHVAESPEEMQFVRDGSGPLRELLSALGIDLSRFQGYGVTPIALLLDDWLMPWLGDSPQNRGQSPLVLVHCNYAQDGDFELLAATKPSVCWCPRSHAYFGHEAWPLAKMREAGVNLVLGTDSLASSDGLDMLGELRQAAKHPDANTVELFKAATVNGRKAMGTPNDAADLTIWGLPQGDDILQGMIENDVPLYASFSQGNLIARAI
jgi:aminodeoxyfutalosine deaminase